MKLSHKYLAAFLLSIVLSGMSARAQMTSYKILYDDPLSYKNLFININFFDVEGDGVRAGLGGEFTLNRRLYFYGEYGQSYLRMGINSLNDKQMNAEAGGMFSFSSKVKTKNYRLKFREGGSSYKMKIQAQAHKQIGVRGGLNSFTTSDKLGGDYWTRTSTQTIYGGIGFMGTRNPLIDVDGYGTFDRKSRGLFYMDVMFAPVITYKDDTDYQYLEGSASLANPADFPDKVRKDFVGGRIGYMKQANWPLPLRQGLEIGYRPGVGSGMYFTARIAVSLGMKIGKPKSNAPATTEPATTEPSSTPDPSAQPK